MTMLIGDVLIVLATFAGPIAAVQAQKFIERAREARARKLHIFDTLMATRALRAASEDHVRALNSIDIVFSGKLRKERAIIEKWSEYLDHLNNYPKDDIDPRQASWNDRSIEFMAELLKTIGDSLGYSFTIVQLKRGIYYPRGHDEDLGARIALKNMLVGLADGKWSLPLEIKRLPIDPDAFKLQLDVQKAILAAFEGEKRLSVTISPGAPGAESREGR